MAPDYSRKVQWSLGPMIMHDICCHPSCSRRKILEYARSLGRAIAVCTHVAEESGGELTTARHCGMIDGMEGIEKGR